MTRRTRSIQISDVIRAAIKLPSGLDITDQANTARNQANSAFDHANTAYSHAGNAFNHANNAHNQANAAYSAANTKLNSSGGTISGNLIVTGNLFVEGDSTSFNVASLLIEDSEIYLNNNQTTPSLNASIFAERGSSTDTFIRWNESTDKWGWSDDGSAFYSFDDVRSGLATTNTTFGTINTNIGTAYSQANAAYSQANAAYGQANSAFAAANNRVLKSGDTMTGSLTLGAGRTVGAGGIVLSHTGLNTDVLANGRAAGVSTGWGTFRIHQEAGNPGLIIAGDANQTAPFLRIQNSSETARLVFDAGGNLLIGTTSTGYGKLGVESGNTFFGVAPSTYTSAIFGPRPATDGYCSVVLQYNTSGNYWKFDSSSSAFTFYENGTLKSYFTNSGQLVLSATTGTAPLVISSTTAVANLNADLLDGYQGSSFVQRTNSGDQATLWDPYGQYYTAVWGVGNDYNNFINSGSYHVDNAATNRPEATYGFLRVWRHIGSNYALQEFTSSSTPVTTWRRLAQDNGSGGRIWTGWAKYWSDGNDGSGSGLDADLLDGVQGSSFLRSDQSATNSVDLRAPNFYISADTSNRFGQGVLIIRNAAPTIYFQDTDHNSGMWHCNASLMYLLRGGNDTTSWSQVSGQWPFIFNLANNDATCGGNFAAVGNVTAYSSDRRLKINIQNIPNALDKVLSLNGVTFDWVDRVKELGFTPDTMINDAGVIAQEVQEVLPQAVKPAPFDREWNVDKSTTISKSGENFITVQYEKIVPLLIEAIKELKAEIDTLKQRG